MKRKDHDDRGARRRSSPPPSDGDSSEEPSFRFEDRRHWMRDQAEETEAADTAAPAKQPSLIEEYRQRTEQAEGKLQEYIEAFKKFKEEQEQVRRRLARDVDRKVQLKFGEVVTELLEAVDDLELALEHVRQVPEAAALSQGVELARKRFLETLERHGVERVHPHDSEFDPNESEALRVDPVDSRERNGRVTEVLRPGYRLGDRVIRPARVAVGRYVEG